MILTFICLVAGVCAYLFLPAGEREKHRDRYAATRDLQKYHEEQDRKNELGE